MSMTPDGREIHAPELGGLGRAGMRRPDEMNRAWRNGHPVKPYSTARGTVDGRGASLLSRAGKVADTSADHPVPGVPCGWFRPHSNRASGGDRKGFINDGDSS